MDRASNSCNVLQSISKTSIVSRMDTHLNFSTYPSKHSKLTCTNFTSHNAAQQDSFKLDDNSRISTPVQFVREDPGTSCSVDRANVAIMGRVSGGGGGSERRRRYEGVRRMGFVQNLEWREGFIECRHNERLGCVVILALNREGECVEVGKSAEKKPTNQMNGNRPSFLKQTQWGGEQLAQSDRPFHVTVVTQTVGDQLSVATRLFYSLVMYGGMALAGKFLCDATNVNFFGGFQLNAEHFYMSLLYALPPIFGSLVLHQDSVVGRWTPAKAIRDVEDEELAEFFLGMHTWQYSLIVAGAAIAEEFFFRAAVQGSLSHALQVSSMGVNESTHGIASLTGIVPSFALYSQAMACVLTAVVTGSLFYVVSSPKDPKMVVARGVAQREVRKSVEAWHEHQKMKKIYSPILESLLSLYLGFEWITTGNLLAPIVTHGMYSISVVANGMRRLEERERTQLSLAGKEGEK